MPVKLFNSGSVNVVPPQKRETAIFSPKGFIRLVLAFTPLFTVKSRMMPPFGLVILTREDSPDRDVHFTSTDKIQEIDRSRPRDFDNA